jgi:hypothetical protein
MRRFHRFVIPAKAGIHSDFEPRSRLTKEPTRQKSRIKMDPGFRRDDKIERRHNSAMKRHHAAFFLARLGRARGFN